MRKKFVLIFVAGFASGIVAAKVWPLVMKAKNAPKTEKKDKFFKDFDETEEQDEKAEPPKSSAKEEEMQRKTTDIFDYSNLTDAFGYSSEGISNRDETHYRPYVISEDDYNDPDYQDYETEALTYYADSILARSNDEIITNPEEIIGPNALGIFDGESANVDVVYVRDDSSNIQYEIDRDIRKYEEVVGPIDSQDDDW